MIRKTNRKNVLEVWVAMAESPEGRPYAAPSNVIAVILRARTRNLPETITNDFLRIAGIPEVVFGRVTTALRFLNLVHEDGRPTDDFRSLAAASEVEYKELLAGVIKNAYYADLVNIDPAQDTQGRIMDAFRRYQPRSQTQRMVMLFLGLCREAGIPVLDAPRQRRMVQATKKSANGTTRDIAPNAATTTKRRDNIAVSQTPNNSDSSPLFGVTLEDIGALDQADFKEVWDALGKVARARALKSSQDRRAARDKAYATNGQPDGEDLEPDAPE